MANGDCGHAPELSPDTTADAPVMTDAPAPAAPDAASAAVEFPILEIEMELNNLRWATSILGHLAASPHNIEEGELLFVQNNLTTHTDRLAALWDQVWAEEKRDRAAHETALAEANKAAAPSSEASAEKIASLRRLMRACAEIVLVRCAASETEA